MWPDPAPSGPLQRRLVVEYGVELDGVWLPIAMLRRLATHGPWDKPFTEATEDQERVLVAHSLAERHNRSGLHRGMGLTGFLDAIPFEPTVPFPAVPAEPAEPPEEAGEAGNAADLGSGQADASRRVAYRPSSPVSMETLFNVNDIRATRSEIIHETGNSRGHAASRMPHARQTGHTGRSRPA